MNGPKPKFPPKEKPFNFQPHLKTTKTFRARGTNVTCFFGEGRIASKRENWMKSLSNMNILLNNTDGFYALNFLKMLFYEASSIILYGESED